MLVVLDGFDRDDVRRVLEIALEVDERINPLVAGKWERDAVEAFISEGGEDIEVREGWSPHLRGQGGSQARDPTIRRCRLLTSP